MNKMRANKRGYSIIGAGRNEWDGTLCHLTEVGCVGARVQAVFESRTGCSLNYDGCVACRANKPFTENPLHQTEEIVPTEFESAMRNAVGDKAEVYTY